jgi:hypothetical protein
MQTAFEISALACSMLNSEAAVLLRLSRIPGATPVP